VPADAGQVDDVELAAPRKLRRLTELHAGERALEVFHRQFLPVAVEVVHFEGNHLVLLPIWDVDVLEQEVGPAETQSGKTVSLPLLLDPQRREELDRPSEVTAGGNERAAGSRRC
jgi:hypothetical protein